MAHCTWASSRELGRRGRASTMRQKARRHRVAAREGSWLITASAAVGFEEREGTWRHVEATRPERRPSSRGLPCGSARRLYLGAEFAAQKYRCM